MATAAPSRAVLSRWMTETLNEPIGTAPEKKCSNGVVYCQLLEAVRPGSLNMAKVNLAAHEEHASLANYRVLAAGLEKAGLEKQIDPSLLCKGQPAATLELLHKIYQMASPESQQVAGGKGLAPLDPNAMGGDRRAGKRRAGAPAPAAAAAPKRANSQPEPPPPDAAGAPTAGAPAAEPAPTPVEAILRQQLEDARNDAAKARAEAGFLVEERDFYMSKLECIEDACASVPAEQLAVAVLKLLGANEDEVAAASAALS